MSLKISDIFSIKDKVAIVTGGSRGIGKMIAQGYVENGAKVYITSRKAEACDATAAELSKLGTCISIPADLATNEGRTKFVEAFKAKESKLDILVNNAGASWGASFDEFPESGWDKVMDINLKAIFFLTQALMPMLEKDSDLENPARVINIGSMDALLVSGGEAFPYGPSKAAVHWMTKNLALRLTRGKGVTFNSIAPGPFESKMMEYNLENYKDLIVRNNSLGRIGVPSDMAGVSIFLASKAGSYLNGAVIPVAGGADLGRPIL